MNISMNVLDLRDPDAQRTWMQELVRMGSLADLGNGQYIKWDLLEKLTTPYGEV